MSDDDAKTLAELRSMRDSLSTGRASSFSASTINQSVALIERLAADVARKDAEIERLRPKKMTLKRAAEVMNDQRHMGASDWKARGTSVLSLDAKIGYRRLPAIDVAEMLLRDAGPIATPPEQAGEEKP